MPWVGLPARRKGWVGLPVGHWEGSLPSWQHQLVGSLLLAGLLHALAWVFCLLEDGCTCMAHEAMPCPSVLHFVHAQPCSCLTSADQYALCHTLLGPAMHVPFPYLAHSETHCLPFACLAASCIGKHDAFGRAEPYVLVNTESILVTALLLQPLRVPGFAFAWLELISHRSFMPKLLLAPGHKGWSHFQRLLVALLRFLEPYLRNAELTDAVRLLYKVWLPWRMLRLAVLWWLIPQSALPIRRTTCLLLTPRDPCARNTFSLQCIPSFLALPYMLQMQLHGLPCSLQCLWCG